VRVPATTYAECVPELTSTRMSERMSTSRADLDALLDAQFLAHVSLAPDGNPVVFPTLIARDGDHVLIHGSTGSRWMRALAGGTPPASL
jgi:nitroimidazol reductase NimA-like FMN-containing flavoprotein (pyridoxamine 5'-phosphate oxidase superfamily)